MLSTHVSTHCSPVTYSFRKQLGHPGLSNGFLAATGDPLVREFGTKATLERFHAKMARRLMVQSGLLHNLSAGEQTTVMRSVHHLILQTDFAAHAGST